MAMKKFKAVALSIFAALSVSAGAESLVLLHTNDTHSLIDPDASGAGGVLQRKAIIDSVRRAEKNVMLIDAGDVVQGTLYFKFFRGDVEFPLMNMAGYDIQILGNHEFDNGIRELADHYRTLKAKRLSANYDVKGTPLEGLFDPYVIKKIGGKKIGFIGLNVDPASLIATENIEGVKFKDIISTANETAAMLKNDKKCDLVVVVSHIGYTGESGKTTDVDLAKASRDIDIIIGGHSHTLVDPAHPEKYTSLVMNAAGRPVLIAQTGKYGKNLGYIKIDLDALKNSSAADYDYKLIPVTDRFPAEALDKKMSEFLKPFRASVDSVNNRVIARALYDLDSDARTGGYPNFAADFAYNFGLAKAKELQDMSVDLGLMNVGGIRHSMKAGDVTEGQILATFPFANRMVVTAVKGSDLLDVLQVAATKGGEGVSGNVCVLVNPDRSVAKVLINGLELDPDKVYNVSTIDYVAAGNDDLTGMANGTLLWRDSEEMAYPMLRYVESFSRRGLPIAPDPTPRFLPVVEIDL